MVKEPELKGIDGWANGMYQHSVQFYPPVTLGKVVWHPFPSNPLTDKPLCERTAKQFEHAGFKTKIVKSGNKYDLYMRK